MIKEMDTIVLRTISNIYGLSSLSKISIYSDMLSISLEATFFYRLLEYRIKGEKLLMRQIMNLKNILFNENIV